MIESGADSEWSKTPPDVRKLSPEPGTLARSCIWNAKSYVARTDTSEPLVITLPSRGAWMPLDAPAGARPNTGKAIARGVARAITPILRILVTASYLQQHPTGPAPSAQPSPSGGVRPREGRGAVAATVSRDNSGLTAA